MKLKVSLLPSKKTYEKAELQFEKYIDGATDVFFDAKTNDGYKLHSRLTENKQALIVSMLIKSLTGNDLDYICDIANKCRGENKDSSLDSMLGELESNLAEIAELSIDCVG